MQQILGLLKPSFNLMTHNGQQSRISVSCHQRKSGYGQGSDYRSSIHSSAHSVMSPGIWTGVRITHPWCCRSRWQEVCRRRCCNGLCRCDGTRTSAEDWSWCLLRSGMGSSAAGGRREATFSHHSQSVDLAFSYVSQNPPYRKGDACRILKRSRKHPACIWRLPFSKQPNAYRSKVDLWLHQVLEDITATQDTKKR